MGFFDFLIAVLGANLLTVMFIYGALNFTKKEREGEWDWTYWGAMLCLWQSFWSV